VDPFVSWRQQYRLVCRYKSVHPLNRQTSHNYLDASFDRSVFMALFKNSFAPSSHDVIPRQHICSIENNSVTCIMLAVYTHIYRGRSVTRILRSPALRLWEARGCNRILVTEPPYLCVSHE
jgi:hypothetical protein